MAEIDKRTGGAHRTEGPGCYYVHFSGGLFEPLLVHQIDDLLGGYHDRLAFFDLLIDFCDSLRHLPTSVSLKDTLPWKVGHDPYQLHHHLHIITI